MKGIATILRETDVRQITGRLVKFDTEGEVEGKCALGVISCGVGLTLGSDYSSHPNWEEILLKAEVPKDVVENDFIPVVDGMLSGEVYDEDLQNYIVHLNDNLKLTFKEIADCIETTFPDEEWSK